MFVSRLRELAKRPGDGLITVTGGVLVDHGGVSDEIRQIQSQDPEIQEEWLRETDDPEIRDVDACRIDEIGGWLVFVSVMEYVRKEPLESDLRQRIAVALRNVAGVASVDEHDREQWFVTGAPSGRALIDAVARVVDGIDEQTQADYGLLGALRSREPGC